MKIKINPKLTKYLLPMHPTVFITTVSKKKEHNAAAYAACIDFSYDPPMVLFASNKVQHQPINTQAVDKNRKQDTYLNIMETKMFIINVPGMNLIKKLQIIGYPFPRGIDEIKRAGLTKYKPFVLFKKNIYPCLIKECLAHLECKLIKIINIKKADHFLIIGEVVGASYDSSLGKNLDKIRKNLTQKVFGNLHAISKNKRLIGQIKQIRKTAPVYTSDKFFNKQKKRIDLN